MTSDIAPSGVACTLGVTPRQLVQSSSENDSTFDQAIAADAQRWRLGERLARCAGLARHGRDLCFLGGARRDDRAALRLGLAWEVAVAAGHGFLRSFWVYAKCPVMLPPAKKAVMRFILAGSLLAGLNGRSVDLIARNGDERSRAGSPPSSDLAMVDVGAHRRMWRYQIEVDGHRRRPGAIVGNGDAAARRARPGRRGIVGRGDARGRVKVPRMS